MIRSFIKTSALAMACLGGTFYAQAQSFVVDFEDVEIPEGFPSLSKSITPDPDVAIDYEFVASGLTFQGFQMPWNAFSGFDCSRGTDSTDHSYANDFSAIAGAGYDGSDQYIVAYLNQIFPDSPQYTEPIGFKLSADSTVVLQGVYVTNTTLTYGYIESNWEHISSYQLRARGIRDGVPTGEEIVLDLARRDGLDTVLVRAWTYLDLEDLGEVDSVSFYLYSDDATTYTPFYVAFDQFIFKDKSSSAQDFVVADFEVSLRPNPTQGQLFVSTEYAGKIRYELMDVFGRIVRKEDLQHNQISLEEFPSGQYLIHFLSEKNQSLGTQKIQKL